MRLEITRPLKGANGLGGGAPLGGWRRKCRKCHRIPLDSICTPDNNSVCSLMLRAAVYVYVQRQMKRYIGWSNASSHRMEIVSVLFLGVNFGRQSRNVIVKYSLKKWHIQDVSKDVLKLDNINLRK